jgi:hypothetical protein
MSDYTSLHHPISLEPQRLPRCCICNAPVLLETSKTDEYGQALHEECYVHKLGLTEEWVVLKLWLKADFLNKGGPYAGPRQISRRSAKFEKRRWQMAGNRQYQKARRACDILIQRAKRGSWHKRPWNLGLAAVVTVLLFTCWMVYGDGHPASFLGSFGLQRSNALEAQINVPAQAVVTKGISKPLPMPVSVEEADAANLLMQVRDGEFEVVHIGDDVTVRYFATKPTRTAPGSGREVSSRFIGDDVTVRYFTPIDRSATD